MKKLFVADLITEQSITAFFLFHAKEIRNTKEGKSYLRMELGDRSGTIEARMWTKFEVMVQDIVRDDFVKVEGRVELYRDKPQLALLQFRKARPEEIELADFLPHTKEDVEKMYAQLLGYAKEIRNTWLQQLVLNIVNDPSVSARYKKAPAAKTMHHAFLGGLLEHVVGLCGIAAGPAEVCRDIARRGLPPSRSHRARYPGPSLQTSSTCALQSCRYGRLVPSADRTSLPSYSGFLLRGRGKRQ